MNFNIRDNARLNDTRKMRAAGLSPAHASRLANTRTGSSSGLLLGGGLLGLAAILGGGVIVFQPSGTADPQIAATAIQPTLAAQGPAVTGPAERIASQAIPSPSPVPTPAQPVTTETVAAPANVPAPQPAVLVAVDQSASEGAVPVLANDCVTDLARVVSGQSIYFDLGSAVFNPSAVPVLERIASAGAECPAARVLISGHSDSTGDDLINLQLSWQRADNTLTAIEALGLNTERFETAGFGARTPAEQGSDSEDPINRRVSFRVLRADAPAVK
jgi:outer membrane protein OmpA-like peptidoglycan-associated protein